MDSAPESHPAPELAHLAAKKPVTDESGTDLAALVAELRHEALIAQDTVAGLTAELATLHQTLDAMNRTDLGKAYARIDKLEDQREAMLHELRWAIKNQREEIENVRASTTWRVGSIFVRPIAKLTGRARP